MSKKNEMAGLITGLVAVLAAACFFILGFSVGAWNYAWLLFLAVPLTAVIMDLAMKNKDITGSIIGLIAIGATGAFLILGFVFGKWHPGWLVFLAIPLAGIIFDILKRKDYSAIVGIVALAATVAFILMGTFLHIWHIAWLVYLAVPITAIVINMIKVAGKADATEAQAQQKEQE